MSGLPDRPMPMRSGARTRPSPTRPGITLRHRNDEVGLPWSRTIGLPSPASSWCILESTTETLGIAGSSAHGRGPGEPQAVDALDGRQEPASLQVLTVACFR